MPWLLLGSASLLVVLAIVLPLISKSGVADEIFRPLVAIALAELILALHGMVTSLQRIDRNTQPRGEDFSFKGPPYSVGASLLDALERTQVGEFWVVCYGSNHFGKVLDAVIDRFPRIQTHVLVCEPAQAIHPDDGAAIAEFIEELDLIPHVTIHQSHILPTVRAALLRNAVGAPVWASVSFYLVHDHRRALRSEGISPVMFSEESNSTSMATLEDFIDREFNRLAATSTLTADAPPDTEAQR